MQCLLAWLTAVGATCLLLVAIDRVTTDSPAAGVIAALLVPAVLTLTLWSAATRAPLAVLRGTWRPTLVAVLGVMVLVAGLNTWLLRPRAGGWQVVAVGPGSRSLQLIPFPELPCIEPADASVERRTADELRLKVTTRPEACSWGSFESRSLPVVHLDRPLAGERLTGTSRVPVRRHRGRWTALDAGGTPVVDSRGRLQVELRMPRVIGLRPADARALLGRGSQRLGVITWDGPSGAEGRMVAEQDPAPGAVLRRIRRGDDLARWAASPIRLTTAD